MSVRRTGEPIAWITKKGKHIPIFEEYEPNKDKDIAKNKAQADEKNGKISDKVNDAIKAYTAKGGEQSSKYPLTSEKTKLLQDYVDNREYTTQEDIYRHISVSEKEKEKIFNQLYDNDTIEHPMTGLNSFTKNKTRSFGYGGSKQESIVYKIPKGTKVNGADISGFSVYDEQEVLLGKNSFIADYKDVEFMNNGTLIITLKRKGKIRW